MPVRKASTAPPHPTTQALGQSHQPDPALPEPVGSTHDNQILRVVCHSFRLRSSGRGGMTIAPGKSDARGKRATPPSLFLSCCFGAPRARQNSRKKRGDDFASATPGDAPLARGYPHIVLTGLQFGWPCSHIRQATKAEPRSHQLHCRTTKAEPQPSCEIDRESGTDSANGGWLRRLVTSHGKLVLLLKAARRRSSKRQTPLLQMLLGLRPGIVLNNWLAPASSLPLAG
jgi:hypothetical protein